MSAKVSGLFGKVVAAVFTTIVGPVAVHVLVNDLDSEGAKPARAHAAAQTALPDGERSLVIVEGVGLTPEDALRDGVRKALGTVLVSLTDENARRKQDRAAVEAVLRDGTDFVLRCEVLGGG